MAKYIPKPFDVSLGIVPKPRIRKIIKYSKICFQTWDRIKTITENSEFSHAYVRRPENYKAPFCFFWANGHAHNFSRSNLYFGDFHGNIWQLPYTMTNDFEKPIKIN